MLKKLLYILVAVIALGPLATMAQEQTFTGTPLVREGSEWCFKRMKDNKYYYQYIKGDTILNGIPYKKLYEECTCVGTNENEIVNQTVAFMREVNGRVYVVEDTAKRYYSCGRSEVRTKIIGEYYDLNKEFFLYDFNNVEDFLNILNARYARFSSDPNDPIAHYYSVPTEIENVLVPGRPCYKIINDAHNKYLECGIYMEGIGFVTDVYKWYGDLISYYFEGVYLCVDPHPKMVYMKNAYGEYEYLDEDIMPSGIDLLKHSDMKVQAADGHIAVSLPDYVNSGMLEVIDLNGRVVASQVMTGNHADIRLKHCAKGMYIVQFRAEGHLATQKVVL